MKQIFFAAFFLLIAITLIGRQDSLTLIKPARVFDGEAMHTGWVVLVDSNRIVAAGPMNFKLPANTRIITLENATLLPGLIEGHSHLFLHPYNETSWNDQVLLESRAERIARAVTHAKATLLAGFTTVRDLGTEGAMYDDVGLKTAIEKEIIPGPRMIVATRAIVASGSYGPNLHNADIDLPKGAAAVSNSIEMAAEVRTQIGKGADLVKLYADYRWGKNEEAAPTFTVEEMEVATGLAAASGRKTVAHASTKEGMRRAVLAGVNTIEHGDQGDAEIFKLMKENNIAFCPTLAATESITQYKGWRKGTDPEPERIVAKKQSFKAAISQDVTICMGGDVGVFAHGDNAREMELMVEYGMQPLAVLQSATSVNADVFGYGDEIGRLKKGLFADMMAVQGDPSIDMQAIRKVLFVMKNGKVYRQY